MTYAQLVEASHWLFSRPWPGRHSYVDDAFENFRRVADDLAIAIREDFTLIVGMLRLRPHYKEMPHNPNYVRDLEDYQWLVDLVHDLVLELTRAVNEIAKAVRTSDDPLYRLEEGLALVERTDGIGGSRLRVTYEPDEFADSPYPGLPAFTTGRQDRDLAVGEGENPRAMALVRPMKLDDA